jgi:hypothetical protein
MRGACILFLSFRIPNLHERFPAGRVSGSGPRPPSEVGVDSAPNSCQGTGYWSPLNGTGIHEMFARSSPVRHDPCHE